MTPSRAASSGPDQTGRAWTTMRTLDLNTVLLDQLTFHCGPCGGAEGPYAAEPTATLALHLHRELIHHGAEIALLRDLWTHRAGWRGQDS